MDSRQAARKGEGHGRPESTRKIVIATRNPKKLKEIKRLFKNTNIKTFSLVNFPKAPRVVEDKKDFKGNAVKKARVLSRFTKMTTLADDSGRWT